MPHYQKEALAIDAKLGTGLHNDLLSVANALFLSCDFDHTIFASSSFIVYKGTLKGLIFCRNNLVKLELKATNIVVLVESIKVGFIINVEHINLVVFGDFKIVLHVELFDPLWVEIIVNDLSHAKLLPSFAILFVKNGHAVSPCECIQIW